MKTPNPAYPIRPRYFIPPCIFIILSILLITLVGCTMKPSNKNIEKVIAPCYVKEFGNGNSIRLNISKVQQVAINDSANKPIRKLKAWKVLSKINVNPQLQYSQNPITPMVIFIVIKTQDNKLFAFNEPYNANSNPDSYFYSTENKIIYRFKHIYAINYYISDSQLNLWVREKYSYPADITDIDTNVLEINGKKLLPSQVVDTKIGNYIIIWDKVKKEAHFLDLYGGNTIQIKKGDKPAIIRRYYLGSYFGGRILEFTIQ
jgi:hypothetical protein